MRTLPTFLVAGLLLAPVIAQAEKEQPAGKVQDAKLEQKAKPKRCDLGSTVDAALTLRDINGNTHRFGDYRGKVVLFYFWSCWQRGEEQGSTCSRCMNTFTLARSSSFSNGFVT